MAVFYMVLCLLSLPGVLSICTMDEQKSLLEQIRTKLWMVEKLTQNMEETCNREQPPTTTATTTSTATTTTTQPPQPSSTGGSVYVRWGNAECPTADGTELVYTGFIGGSRFSSSGGAANYMCLPEEPQWAKFKNGTTDEALIYGAEYEDNTGRAKSLFGKDMDDMDPPCAVCYSTRRGSRLMIPARTTCVDGWTLEYTGYLMSGKTTHDKASEYVCVDKDMGVIPRSAKNNDNAVLLYLVEAQCSGAMKCPPYVDGREVACVVCTK